MKADPAPTHSDDPSTEPPATTELARY
jgi:hypothetical protein